MARQISDVLAAARAGLRHQPTEVRVRADKAGRTVVDTLGAHLVWEPRRLLPVYAVPEADLRGVTIAPAEHTPPSAPDRPLLLPDVPFAAHTCEGEALDLLLDAGGPAEVRVGHAAFRPADEALAGLVLLDPASADAWWQEDVPVVGHPRDPFHRVDALPSRRSVTVRRDGEVLARSDRAVVVNETGFPLRWYLPRADVFAALAPTATTTGCPYKGTATYWAAAGVADVAWSYEHPFPEVVPAAGHVCFDDREVDIEIGA